MKRFVVSAVLIFSCFCAWSAEEKKAGPVEPVQVQTKIISTVGMKPEQRFKILKAAFGVKQRYFDVTRLINEALAKNQKNIRASVEIFGDPFRSEAKILEIVYTVNNEIKAVSVHENELLDFSLLK